MFKPSKELITAYNKAKIGLLTNGSIFLTTITFSLKHSWDTSIPTAKTNGLNLYINPDFFMSIPPNQRVFLLYHESWHVALNHMLRRGNREKVRYNKAGDYLINGMAIHDGFEVCPGALVDKKYNNMSTNEIYELLPTEPEQPKNSSGGYDCDILNPQTPEETANTSVKIKQVLVRAKTASKMGGERSGVIPNELSRIIDELINPILPWEQLLDKYLSAKAKDDYTWTKPNRRFMPEYYLPTQYSEALGHIVIAIDTSGSISKKDLTKILSEIKYIHEKFSPDKLTILDCDRKIHNVYEVTPDMDITELNFQGGGGTSFNPVIEFCNSIKPEVLLYFTDLYATQIQEELDYPILWLCYSSHEAAPIGDTIYYKS